MAPKNIEVVGAGPAGLASAIELARAGLGVTLYEKRGDVGARFPGDFQGLENWSSEEDAVALLDRLGLYENKPFDFICHPYYELIVFDSTRKKTVMKSDRPFFYIVKRGSGEGTLDKGLLKVAEAYGVRVVLDKKVERLDNGGIVSIGPRRLDVMARGMVFKTGMNDLAATILDDRLAPKGYAYLLIHNGLATVASCIFNDFKDGKACFERTVEAFEDLFPGLDIIEPKEFAGYGNFTFGSAFYESGRYYVGEAAGLQDCLWGFGIKYAVLSGYIAARCILEGADYTARIKKELMPLKRASLVNRFFYERFGDSGYKNFIRTLASGETRERLRELYNSSLTKSLAYPMVKLRYKSLFAPAGCGEKECTAVWCSK